MLRRRRIRSSGFSLLEVLVSMAILGIGAALSLKLIGVFINTNKRLSSNHEALALASRMTAEVMNAPFRSPTDIDPGLQVSANRYELPVVTSVIQSVGAFYSESYLTVAANTLPNRRAKFMTSYLVSACPSPACDVPNPASPGNTMVGGIDIFIEVRNAGDPSQGADAPLFRPVRMSVRRTYSHALNCSTLPPGTPCIGRAY
jgi:prepilin-type N-terminal cleavage/methylation domain-containing protein